MVNDVSAKLTDLDAPVVLVQKECPLCNSTEVVPVATGKNILEKNGSALVRQFHNTWIQLLECKDCGFGFTKEIPVHPAFFKERYDLRFDAEAESKNPFKHKIHEDIFALLKKYGSTEGSLLDVGSFAGIFLQKAQKQGYAVQGIETNPTMAAYSKNGLGLSIIQEEFLKAPLATESFNVISFIDVLEHLVKPREVLAKSVNALRPGGFLLIKVPNFKLQLYKQKVANLLQLSTMGIFENFGHINHFSPKALEKCFGALGLKTCEIVVSDSEKWPEKTVTNKLKNILRSTAYLVSEGTRRAIGVNLGFNIIALAQKKK